VVDQYAFGVAAGVDWTGAWTPEIQGEAGSQQEKTI
jgi:hypothetical protein